MAKFNPATINLQAAPAPLYCVVGDELLLRIESVDTLRHWAQQHDYSERSSLSLSATDDWGVIEEFTQSLSLFAERKILELVIPTGKPGTKGAQALIRLAEEVRQGRLVDTVVIISLPKLDFQTTKAKWWQSLSAAAEVYELPIIQREQLPAWITERLKRQQQSVDRETLAWIVDRVEGNLFAAHQEIIKLGLMYPEGDISFEAIQQSIQDVARFDVMSLSSAMLQGDATRTRRIIEGLAAEGEALPLILGFMMIDIRHLYHLAVARSKGLNPSSQLRSLYLRPPKSNLILQALERLSLMQLMGLIQHAHDVDRILKGIPVEGRLNDPWQELLRLALKIVNPQTV
ncbi:DNA polymerase III subunit delta [Oligella urethralis]|uniref:DNA polymerase III subunit delta n=1 Tax=Oligella urethralis TaxID=90245 RepID=A0A2X1UJZ3_9BURK|nr:DNA polymerase III subunit delta [Oligella urethralis]SPY06848.1 DNA polymerase III subunit delta [Oligella urethralis]SPY07489.1 DNA polymerase III subunit delta [Oligella urethralis]